MKKTISTIVGLAALVVAPLASATTLYYHGHTNTNLYSYDTDTNTETLIGSTGINRLGGLAVSGNGSLYAIHQSTTALYVIDPNSASTTLIGNTSVTSEPEGLTFGLDGTTLYASGGGSLYSVDTSTGAATNLGAIGMGDVDGLTVAPFAVSTPAGLFDAGTLFANDGSSIYAIDPNTLVTTLLGNASGASESISFDSDGNLFTHDFSGSLYQINPLTLATTLLGPTSGPITGLAAYISGGDSGNDVPVPAPLALLLAGLVGLGLRRKA